MPKFFIPQIVSHLNQSANKAVIKVRQEIVRSLDMVFGHKRMCQLEKFITAVLYILDVTLLTFIISDVHAHRTF